MIRPIVKDIFFLGQKSEEATKQDLSIGQDLQDTLKANQDRCIGMAANMIGFRKRAIIVRMGFLNMVMYNPVISHTESSLTKRPGSSALRGCRILQITGATDMTLMQDGRTALQAAGKRQSAQ